MERLGLSVRLFKALSTEGGSSAFIKVLIVLLSIYFSFSFVLGW